MKKFISALSSFVIAATAMGGSMVMPINAANVEETIVAIRSNGKSEIQVDAGAKIPVEIYIPQSSGFNSTLLKFGIGKDGNLDDTKGKGSVFDRLGNEIKNYKDAFGNYGITMTAKGDKIGNKQTDFSYPNCLESGKTTDFYMDAGDIPDTGIAMFNPEAWSILYQAKPEIEAGVNVDAYGAWVAAGGVLDEDFDYSNYVPVSEWTKDESWAYEYTFTKLELQLPEDMPDGTYVFDVYKDVFINCHPGSLFTDSNEPVPDDERSDAKSNFKGIGGEQNFSTEKLTIRVGNPTEATTAVPPTTTEAPATTTAAPATTVAPITTDAPITTVAPTTTAVVPETAPDTTPAPVITEAEPTATQAPANAIIYNLIPHNKEYIDAESNGLNYNKYTAEPGEAIQVDWTIKHDQGTAGLQMSFDFSQVEYISGKRGGAYRITPTYSDFNNTDNMQKGEVIYTWAQSDENFADDGKIVYSFNIKAPESGGTYFIGLNENPKEVSKVVPKAQDQQHTFVMYGLQITVDGPVSTDVTTAVPETVTTAGETTEATAAPTTTVATGTEVPITQGTGIETGGGTTGEVVYTTEEPTTTEAVSTTVNGALTVTQPVATTTYGGGTTAPITTPAIPETTAAETSAIDGTTDVATTVLGGYTTAPTTTVADEADAIIYNLIPHDKEYTPAAQNGNNVYSANPGEELTVDWTVKNDKGTAGIQMNFDFSQVEYISGKRGNAYRVTPTFSDNTNTEGLKKGEVVYTWAQSEENTATDNAVIYSFTVKVPTEYGTYRMGLSSDPQDTNKVVPRRQENEHKFVFHGLDIIVGSDVTTTIDGTATTPANQDGDTLYGDVNCDGVVRIGDVVLLNRYLARNAEVSPQGLLNADCEKDNKLDAKDSVKIKKFLALMIGAEQLGKASN